METEIAHCVVKLRANPSLTIAGTYLKPSNSIAAQLNCLQEHLTEAHYFVVLGDFNCRIGMDSNDLDDLILCNDYLVKKCMSCDRDISSRGSALLRLVDQEGLVVLNGRTVSDASGDFIFVSLIGRSVVDLVICSPLLACLVTDGGTVELASGSDHIFCENPWFNHTRRYFKRCRQNALYVIIIRKLTVKTPPQTLRLSQ